MDTLERGWRQRPGAVFHAKPVVSDEGILFGVGTVLVRKTGDRFDFARDAERAVGLLSIAKRGPAGPHLLHHFRAAALAWSHGEKALAQFHLAYARIAPLESREDAKRLFLAEALMAAGVPPLQLARMVAAGPAEFEKKDCYDPNQPRNPAGCEDISGRWTKEPGGGGGTGTEHTITVHPKAALLVPPPSLIGTILSKEARDFLIATAKRAFADFIEGGGAAVAAVEIFRAVFIPSPNDGVTSQG
jgi:hypothetical protein